MRTSKGYRYKNKQLADKLNRCVPCNENGEDFDDVEDDRNHLDMENRELKSKILKRD